jgi:streptomycin 6-kinase
VLLPVTWQGAPAMLKVALASEEKRGARVLEWWGGEGAAKVLAQDEDALLMEQATGGDSLIEMSVAGRDEEATRIICSVLDRLHAPRMKAPPSDAVPLDRWFHALGPAASAHGGVLAESAAAANELLTAPQDVTVLHGDIHHDNILDFGARGWLAIDPKGLIGERCFDAANLFCNPDDAAADPERFDGRVAIVAEAARFDRTRLLKWILAWAGLSAAFHLKDGEAPDGALRIARLASSRLA